MGDTLAELVRSYRNARGLTQEELAELSTISARAIRNIEGGKTHTIRRSTIEELIRALRLDDDQIRRLTAAAAAMKRRLGSPGMDSAPEIRLGADAADDSEDRVPHSAPHQLPHDLVELIGRRTELHQLHDLLADDGSNPDRPTAIATLEGTGGVGKTTVAVHFAHQVAERFPDGQLFLDLRGFDAHQPPLSAGEALGYLMRGLGRAPMEIPSNLDDQIRTYRSLVAGKRLLIVLDNAAGSEQVRPLLPGMSGSVVIVTTRRRLSGLMVRDGARSIALGVFDVHESRTLIAQAVRADRLAAEPDAAAELARLCGHLPLALRVAADHVAAAPTAKVADLVDELTDARGRLDALTTDDLEIRAVFGWSYQALPASVARAYRFLGLHPSPEISVYAAAALIERDVRETRRLLRTLTYAHLLEDVGDRRYRLHDLLHVYAAERSRLEDTDAERLTAVRRLVRWYVQTADDASKLLIPRRTRPAFGIRDGAFEAPPLATRDEALTWYEAEQQNLIAITHQAAASVDDETAWLLPTIIWDFFYLRKPWSSDWMAAYEVSLAAARRTGDRLGEAWTLSSLGYAQAILRHFTEAYATCESAMATWREIGDGVGQAVALIGLAIADRGQRRFGAAGEHAKKAASLFRADGDMYGEGFALLSVADGHRDRNEDGIPYLQRALALFRSIDEQWGEAIALTDLGNAYYRLGKPYEAIRHFRLAIEAHRENGDRRLEGLTLYRLGLALQTIHRVDEAAAAYRGAYLILKRLGDPYAQRPRRSLDGLQATNDIGAVNGSAS